MYTYLIILFLCGLARVYATGTCHKGMHNALLLTEVCGELFLCVCAYE
jgi:hypothetical protein